METKKRPEDTEARALGTLFNPNGGNGGGKKIDDLANGYEEWCPRMTHGRVLHPCLHLPLSSRNDSSHGVGCGAVSKNYLDRITIEPGKCGGRPCIRGFRLRVKDVLDLLAAGASEQEILSEYDFLEPEDIRACFQYASAQANHGIIRLQPA